MKEMSKFWKDHPVLSISFAISTAFVTQKVLKAFSAEEGEFWNWGFGATTSTSTTTSSSHRTTSGDSEPTIPIPMTFHGIGSSASSKITTRHATRQRTDYGDDSYESPMALYGMPNGLKRRIAHGSIGNDDDAYTPNIASIPDEVTANSVMGDDGTIDQMAGIGWM